jgi:hypothetical protein
VSDIAFVALGIVFLAGSVGWIALCRRLEGEAKP